MVALELDTVLGNIGMPSFLGFVSFVYLFVRHGHAMLPMLALNSWSQVILLLQPASS
jgi:hypothetical protein